jgi:hypothetical protein
MKNSFLFIFILILFVSCDPGYYTTYSIYNKTNDTISIYFYTNDSTTIKKIDPKSNQIIIEQSTLGGYAKLNLYDNDSIIIKYNDCKVKYLPYDSTQNNIYFDNSWIKEEIQKRNYSFKYILDSTKCK